MQELLKKNCMEDGRVEDMGSPLLMKAPKSQLTAKKPSTEKRWNLPKKISNIQRQSRHNKMAEGSNYYKIKSQTHQVDPQIGK